MELALVAGMHLLVLILGDREVAARAIRESEGEHVALVGVPAAPVLVHQGFLQDGCGQSLFLLVLVDPPGAEELSSPESDDAPQTA